MALEGSSVGLLSRCSSFGVVVSSRSLAISFPFKLHSALLVPGDERHRLRQCRKPLSRKLIPATLDNAIQSRNSILNLNWKEYLQQPGVCIVSPCVGTLFTFFNYFFLIHKYPWTISCPFDCEPIKYEPTVHMPCWLPFSL